MGANVKRYMQLFRSQKTEVLVKSYGLFETKSRAKL